MLVSDRFLVALGSFFDSRLRLRLGEDLPVRLRDWSGTKGRVELVLDAEEPVEHGGLYGVFTMEAVVCLKVRARDFEEEERRDFMGVLAEELRENAAGWVDDPERGRGLEGRGLRIYDFRTDDGVWEVDDKWMMGKVQVGVIFSGVNRGD